MIQKRVFLLYGSPSPFVVPNDFGSLVSIECLGSGGIAGTGTGAYLGGGSGGGAYAKITTLPAITAGNTYAFNVASATDTWFDTTGTVLAKCGGSTSSVTGATGGQASSSVGATKFSGGNGGNGYSGGSLSAGGGGGGAAGPNGAGSNGTNASSGVGGNGGSADSGAGGAGGTGGVAVPPVFGPTVGHSGSAGTEFATAGCGGGGGGATGGVGSGAYGGGGGYYGGGTGYGYPAGSGMVGFIVFTYNSAFSPPVSRQCRRLAEPSDMTVEQSYASPFQLQITISLPLAIVQKYAALIPNSGADTLIINYTDEFNQPNTISRSVTLWMSDNGYIFLSTDGLTQLLVASVNGAFFDANAVNINTRNTNASATPLLPCSNASRYDTPKLLTRELLPLVQIYDGVYIQTQ